MPGVSSPAESLAQPAEPAGDVRVHEPLVTPLLVWLVIQLAALLAGAFRLPLSVRAVHPPEALADEMMVVTQIVSAGLLLPVVLPNLRAAVALIASLWPMLFLAGFLASTPVSAIATSGLYVSAWLGGLATLSHVIQSDKMKLAASVGCTLLSLGGPILWYSRAEFFTQTPNVDWTTHGAWGPVMGVLAQLHGTEVTLAPWLVLLAAWLPALAACLWRFAGRYLTNRRPASN